MYSVCEKTNINKNIKLKKHEIVYIYLFIK